jgi:hypothetical protein
MEDRLPAVKATDKTTNQQSPLFEMQDASIGKPPWAKKLESEVPNQVGELKGWQGSSFAFALGYRLHTLRDAGDAGLLCFLSCFCYLPHSDLRYSSRGRVVLSPL